VAARTEPVYPSGARDDGREGTAELRVALDADGRITSVAVSRSAGDARLDRAAADAVRHWRFDPALTDGRATAATLRVNVHFRLY
jgi:protein TonB